MTSFNNILVPIDDSLQSRIAQEMAVFISKLFKSQVAIMHVIPNEVLTPGQTYTQRENYIPISTATGQFPRTLSLPKTRENVFPEEVVREVIEQYRNAGKTLLAKSASLFAEEGIAVKEILVDGNDTAETIIAEAEAGNYDLIIMGNSANEENELDLHLGSVAKEVASSVKTSILIVRKKREAKKILIPVDGSAKDEQTLQTARMIAHAAGAKIVLLHVQEKTILRLRPEIKEIGLQILKNASKMIEGTQSEQKLVAGDPAKAIIQTAEQADVDLIVMGSGERSTLRGFFLGSVSDHVLNHATVPVLLVK
ncbi:MAG: universal stress protein [Candidatus Bathyarchaeota archaeon]|nr:universal stress protein [Candidatus Bathyarchaeota archaeon]